MKPSFDRISRRAWMLGAAGAAIASPLVSRLEVLAADVPRIRYATGGGIGPNEMETIIFLDHLKQNVLKNYGKSYTLDITFTRGTPEAAALLAALFLVGQTVARYASGAAGELRVLQAVGLTRRQAAVSAAVAPSIPVPTGPLSTPASSEPDGLLELQWAPPSTTPAAAEERRSVRTMPR